MTATTKPPPVPKKYTCARSVHWWGKDYTITPAVAREHLGDGRLLLGFQCLNTRPDYYLVRVDTNFFKDDPDGFNAMEEVIELLEEEFGEMEREREHLADDLREKGIEPTGKNTDLAGNEGRLGWPVLNLDSGYHWWEEAVLTPRKK